MNKLLILPIFILTVLQKTSTQQNETIQLLTSGKWFAEYVILENQKMEFAPELQERTWMLLNANQKAEYMINGKKATGQWEYGQASSVLKIIKGQEIQEYRLIEISQAKMVLEEFGEEESIIGWRK
ncbi:hypothetical protein MTsPCn9_10180 [Croceitalea sp. MTPC9]|uniref:hypothetical protein n=1 Tax=unclassified Croceitalea TaxID=2632280 RepID=UPI002B38477F|nr:hypothetical protein MTsPCn6_27060 [Croceitalea sp. MTPC6]GMN16082.1 hypothetical protein MTsPCn9_10180 [Croceitalea sp. MTPC9]